MLKTILVSSLLCTTVDPAEPLTDAQKQQAVEWLDAMKADRRGPYRGVLWFCKDGAILPPKMYACVEHGGGVQYGVLSKESEHLAEWGLHVGTVLRALEADALVQNDYYRARALIVEYYLERALDGWALEKAKTYRGFRQIEDEEEAARELLIELAKREDMLGQHRILLMRLMRATPYGQNSSLADEVRALAGVIGDADMKGFGDLRFKIHAMPEPSDIEQVRAYASKKRGELGAKARELAQKMEAYYDPTTRMERLKRVRRWLRDEDTRAAIDRFVSVDTDDPLELVRVGGELIEVASRAITPSNSRVQGERNLLALHTMAIVEELWLGVVADLVRADLSRADVLELVHVFLHSASRIGWLSARETAEADLALERMGSARPQMCAMSRMLDRTTPYVWAPQGASPQMLAILFPELTGGRWADPYEYATGLKTLSRILEWARARLLAELGIALERYQTIEPRARAVIDDQLRSSVMLPVAALLDRLSADVEKLRGGGHELVGITGARAGSLRGENPGLAIGPLHVLGADESPHDLGRQEIALLYSLPPELPPVAGIITVGAAGSLSHVALLARNLGIPHAAVAGDVADALARHAKEQVVLGVSAGGRVLAGPFAAFPEEDEQALQQKHAVHDEPFLKIDADALDLSVTRIHMLDEISEKSSGVIVGPKAGELGRLERLFPDRVSNAAVIPFGAFVRHVDRALDPDRPSPLARLRQAYIEARKLDDPEAVEAMLLEELAAFREAIATVPFAEGFEAEVEAALGRLGDPGTFGVFVRSDTNVEDLKEFTGAGLNLTVPNRVGLESVLASIRRVWASPFTERSYRWRQRVLVNPEHVYPSVILHRTVPSEISGVLVTCDLETGARDALTISASEGVAAVVDGGAPETVVVGDNGELRLLASSRTATRKIIPEPPAEGVVRATSEGRDPLLRKQELRELRELAREAQAKIPARDGLPWDIEFGLLDGKAYLMQIRPLRTSKSAATHPYLKALDDRASLPSHVLDLEQEVPR